jgi:hypothetical protein
VASPDSLRTYSTSDFAAGRASSHHGTKSDMPHKRINTPCYLWYVFTCTIILAYSNNLSIDICSTALFSRSWFCSSCGREICQECRCDMDQNLAAICSSVPNSAHDLLPITRFGRQELADATRDMKLILDSSASG